MEDYQIRSLHSSMHEAPMNSLVSPQRNGIMPQAGSQDPRVTLPRRFTTDSGRVPTLSSISTQAQDYPSALPTQVKVQLLEKKKLEYEKLREQKRRFEAEMQRLDQAERELQEDLRPLGLTGHQSEPTTPPEYRETNAGFPSVFSRPNRYSMSSVVSPPGFFNRPGRSGSLLASPQSSIMPSRYQDDAHSYRSGSIAQRNGDEDEKEEALRQDPTSFLSTTALNRYSMPVTRRGNLYENIDQTNTTGFLFRDDDSNLDSNTLTGIDVIAEDRFSHYRSQKPNHSMLPASNTKVDLGSGEGISSNGWGIISRHRQQQSLSSIPLQMPDLDLKPIGSRQFRHQSMDMNQTQYKDTTAETPTMNISPSTQLLPSPPKLQSPFPPNEIPTAKSLPGAGFLPANAHAQQHFQHHNASIGRIPPGAVKRHSRDLSVDSHSVATQPGGVFHSVPPHLQGNTSGFGPITSSQAPMPSTLSANANSTTPSAAASYQYNSFNQNNQPPSSYDMATLAMNMQNLGIGGYNPPQNFNTYGPMYPQHRDSQQRVMQQRRALNDDAMNRYINMPLEQVRGKIHELCKDQHGCRYLQKQLENRNPDDVHIIWQETNQHVVELMTDPFGNYLCQKLLEFCNDEERTVLIKNAALDMVRIALNQHGTRALQKMIEFVTTPTQVRLIIEALKDRVVDLIQDLNGNHVIQKCLNKLGSSDSDFIFSSVGNRCVDVGTHRHGCCVLQRCIDHASGPQKIWLISQITDHASELVTNPYGNYVVQYIIDLNEPSFTEPLAQKLLGQICELSRHKFGSNVVEKCLRCASDESKDRILGELLAPGEMQTLLTDSYANYVVQTAFDHSSVHMKHELVKQVRDILPKIQGLPYGRRLKAKVQQYESQGGMNGQITPTQPTQGQVVLKNGRAMIRESDDSAYPKAFGNDIGPMILPSSATTTLPDASNAPPVNAYLPYPNSGANQSNEDGSFF